MKGLASVDETVTPTNTNLTTAPTATHEMTNCAVIGFWLDRWEELAVVD